MYGGSGIEPCCSKYGSGSAAELDLEKIIAATDVVSLHAAGQRDRHVGSQRLARVCVRENAPPLQHALEQDLDLPASRLAANDAGRNDARVVEHEQITRAQQRRQIREPQVVQSCCRVLQMQQAAPRSLDRGPLCNQIFRQVVGEVGAPHWARTVDYTGSSGNGMRNGGAGTENGPGPSTRMPGVPGSVLMIGAWRRPRSSDRAQSCSRRAPSMRFSHVASSGTVISNDMRFFARRTLSFSFSPG